MALVTLLIIIFIITIAQDKKKVLDEKTSSHRALLRNSFDLAMLDTQKGLTELACQMAGNRDLVDAFASRDREKLYQLALPYFNEAKKQGEVDLSGFIGADGVHFLRIQDLNLATIFFTNAPYWPMQSKPDNRFIDDRCRGSDHHPDL
jgi:hypothetical protein